MAADWVSVTLCPVWVRTGQGTSLIGGSGSEIPGSPGEGVVLTWLQVTPVFLLAMWKGWPSTNCPSVLLEAITLGGQW